MKRPLALGAAVIAFACLLVCVAAIGWIWTIKKPVVEKTTSAFDQAAEILHIAHRTTDQAIANLRTSREQMRFVHQTSRDERDGRTTHVIQSAAARSLARQLPHGINDVQNTVEKVTEASMVVNSLLGTIPDVEHLQDFNTEQVRSLQDQIGGVTKASLELNHMLDPARPGGGDDNATERAERIGTQLDTIIELAGEFQKNVTVLQRRVQRYRGRTLYWMELGPQLATAFLGWAAVSQVIVIVVSVRALRRPADATAG